MFYKKDLLAKNCLLLNSRTAGTNLLVISETANQFQFAKRKTPNDNAIGGLVVGALGPRGWDCGLSDAQLVVEVLRTIIEGRLPALLQTFSTHRR